MIINLLISSIICGSVIGMERAIRHKNVGLKTCTLIVVGATVYTYISTQIGGDPSRIIAQVVSGVGFLGAGVIFKDNFNTQGLTTAAIIWVCAAIGCLIGITLIEEAVICTIFVLVINITLNFFNLKQHLE